MLEGALNTPWTDATTNFHAINTTTGEQHWQFNTSASIGPPAVADGTVFFGTKKGRLYALESAH